MKRDLTHESGRIGTYTTTDGEIIVTEGGAELLAARTQRDEAERLLLAMVREFQDEHPGGNYDFCDRCNAVDAARDYLQRRGLLEAK